jgi:FlaA1/EpsC-like NDP-sugar epimerase
MRHGVTAYGRLTPPLREPSKPCEVSHMRVVTTQMRDVIPRFRCVPVIAVQWLLIALSNRAAFMLRFDGDEPGWALTAYWQMLPWLLAVRALTFVPFRLYDGLWRYTGLYDLQALVGGISVSTAIFYAVARSPLGPPVYPRSVFVVDALLLTLLLFGIRLTRRFVAEFALIRPGKRLLIFGAGDAGELIVRDMENKRRYSYEPVGFVDDDRTKLGRRIHGVRVLGTRDDLPWIVKRHRPDEMLIAMPRADAAAIRSIVRALDPFKIPIKTLPNLRDIIDGKVEVGQIRNLAVEDLLARAPVGLDRRPLQQLIAGRRVMVTGAGGSIGSELCRQIARLKPAALVMFERYENSLHEIAVELQDQRVLGAFPVIGDVTDAARVSDVLRQHRPEIIFHAAAHKHVPMMEENPCEAVKNNVQGTRLLAKAAEQYGVDRFILISTDKAVNPASMMGASKRIAELVIQAQADGSGTSFSIVRFGNVLGSNGSVVPRFMQQIKEGGPVTVTHPEMRRFFMLIPEAVQLVLHAASQAENGTTYVLEMGEQVKLLDMARDLIRLSGLVPDVDIEIEFVGLRPGEKLSEELVGPNEDAGPSGVEKVLRVRSRRRPAANLFSQIESLEADAARGHTNAVTTSIRELVAEPGTARVFKQPGETGIPHATAPFAADAERHCPKCQFGRVRRSRVRSVPERIGRKLTAERLFRCGVCGWRGWLLPLTVSDQTSFPDQPAILDLSSIDDVVAPRARIDRLAFSPRDIV